MWILYDSADAPSVLRGPREEAEKGNNECPQVENTQVDFLVKRSTCRGWHWRNFLPNNRRRREDKAVCLPFAVGLVDSEGWAARTSQKPFYIIIIRAAPRFSLPWKNLRIRKCAPPRLTNFHTKRKPATNRNIFPFFIFATNKVIAWN